MGVVIEFPGNDAHREKEFREMLDAVKFPSASLRQCVKDNVARMLVKYQKLPELSFRVEFPAGISEEDGKKIGLLIQEEIKKYVGKAQQPLLLEICRLHVELCKINENNGST